MRTADHADDANWAFGIAHRCRDAIRPSEMGVIRTDRRSASISNTSVFRELDDLEREDGESLGDYFRRIHERDPQITSFGRPNPTILLEGVVCASVHCAKKDCPNNSIGKEALQRLIDNYLSTPRAKELAAAKFTSYEDLILPGGVYGMKFCS